MDLLTVGMRETMAELRRQIIAAVAVIAVLMLGAAVLHWWL
jgi:hypothetical protein